MSDYLILLETGDKLLQESGDFLGIDGIGYFLVTKSVGYAVLTTPAAQTKSVKYCTRAPPAATTKDLKYTVLTTPAAIEQSLSYEVIVTEENQITKSAKYTVITTPSAVTKSAKYTVFTTVAAITKSLSYEVVTQQAATKSAKYTVITTPAAIEQSLYYRIYQPATEHLITKSMSYKVPSYLLKEDGDRLLQENGDRIILENATFTYPAITKSLRYAILLAGGSPIRTQYGDHPAYGSHPLYGGPPLNNFTKALAYKIGILTTLQKSATYRILTHNPITKSLKYTIIKTIQATKDLAYRIGIAHQVQKSASYKVLVNSGAISKVMRYAIIKDGYIYLYESDQLLVYSSLYSERNTSYDGYKYPSTGTSYEDLY